jgi:hypothetical protein
LIGLKAGCWTSAKSFGRDLNLSERGVFRHLRTLRDRGLVTQRRNPADPEDLRVYRAVNRDRITEMVAAIPPKKRRGAPIDVDSVDPEAVNELEPELDEELL